VTMSPEQYAKHLDQATVKVPRPEGRKVWPTQPELARAAEKALKAAKT
jgi:hypothetical protein